MRSSKQKDEGFDADSMTLLLADYLRIYHTCCLINKTLCIGQNKVFCTNLVDEKQRASVKNGLQIQSVSCQKHT